MADYLNDDGPLPKGHTTNRQGPKFSKFESLAKRAAFQAKNYGQSQEVKALANFDAMAADAGQYAGEYVASMTAIVRNTAIPELRAKAIPAIREMMDMVQKETIFLSDTEKKYIHDTGEQIIAFIIQKTTLFARIGSTLKNTIRNSGVVERAAKSESVLLRMAGKAFAPQQADAAEAARLNVRAEAAQRIVAENHQSLESEAEPAAAKVGKRSAPARVPTGGSGVGGGTVLPEILAVDKDILTELKKENENWEQDKEARVRAEDDLKKPDSTRHMPLRVAAEKADAKKKEPGGLFDSLIGGLGKVFTGAIGTLTTLFEFKALKDILGNFHMPSLPKLNEPKLPSTPNGNQGGGIWDKVKGWLPGAGGATASVTTGEVATPLAAGGAGIMALGALIGGAVFAGAAKVIEHEANRRPDPATFKPGSLQANIAKAFTPPAPKQTAHEDLTVGGQAPVVPTIAPGLKTTLDDVEAPTQSVANVATPPQRVPNTTTTDAAPMKSAPARLKIVSIEGFGKGYLIAKMSDGSTQRRNGAMNWRNNNPGNLRLDDQHPWAREHGAIGSADGYAVFPDVETGRKAREQLLFEGKTKQHYDQLSVSKMIEVYAPPSENPTAAYQKFVLAALGGQDAKLSEMTEDQRKTMMGAMERFEGFKSGTVSPTRTALTANEVSSSGQNITVVAPVTQTNVAAGGSGGGTIIAPSPITTGHPDETLQAMRRAGPL